MTVRRHDWLAPLAAAATGVQVGAAIVATRFVVDQVEPIAVAFLRYAIGFCCLLPAAFVSSRPHFARRDLLPLALLGIVQFGILIALLNYGLKFIPSGRAAMIFATMPLLTTVLGALLGRERLSPLNFAGVALTLAGVALALGEKLLAGAGARAWIGELAVFASALSGAVCSVLYRPYLRRYPTLPVGAWAMFAAVVFLACFVEEGFFSAWPQISYAGWLAVAFIGLSSGIGYFLWLWSLTYASPTRVTVFLALSPLTASLLGALLLNEALTPGIGFGLVAIVIGLRLTYWRGGPAMPG